MGDQSPSRAEIQNFQKAQIDANVKKIMWQLAVEYISQKLKLMQSLFTQRRTPTVLQR